MDLVLGREVLVVGMGRVVEMVIGLRGAGGSLLMWMFIRRGWSIASSDMDLNTIVKYINVTFKFI